MHRRSFLLAAAATPILFGCATAEAQPGALPLSFDTGGRPVVEVAINGRGPFPLVLDTAAQMTGLDEQFIQRAGFTPNGGQTMLHGASGARQVDLYTLGQLTIGPLVRENVTSVPLARGEGEASHGGHDGVLGANLFTGLRLNFEYANRRISIDQHAGRPPLAGGTPVELLHNVFVLTPMRVGRVEATGVIDTGARHTLCNYALRDALSLRSEDMLVAPAQAAGATGHSFETSSAQVSGVTLTSARLGPMPLRFADAHVFGQLGLAERPALIVGGDVLHRLARFSIDYASRQIAATAV